MKVNHYRDKKPAAVAAMALLIFFLLGSLPAHAMVRDLGPAEAKTLMAQHEGDPDFAVLDIRTPGEYDQGHIAGAISVDYYNPQFKSRLERLDRAKTYLIYCRSGNRSQKALKIFSDMGFERVYHLSGGVIAWQAKGYDLVK